MSCKRRLTPIAAGPQAKAARADESSPPPGGPELWAALRRLKAESVEAVAALRREVGLLRLQLAEDKKAAWGKLDAASVQAAEERKASWQEAKALREDLAAEGRKLREAVKAMQEKSREAEEQGLRRSRAAFEGLAWLRSSLQAELAEVRRDGEGKGVIAAGPMETSFDLTSVDFAKYEKGKYWQSAPFQLSGLRGFYLCLFPGGDPMASEGKCSCYLCHETGGFEASFDLVLDGVAASATRACLHPGKGWDFGTAASSFSSATVKLRENRST